MRMELLYYNCTFALFIFRLHKLGIEAHAYAHYTSLLCFACFALLTYLLNFVTYEMIPVVGYKTIYPKNKCIAVSYARLLLHDTSLKDHQYRLGLEDTRVCECGQGIEDDYHFFF